MFLGLIGSLAVVCGPRGAQQETKHATQAVQHAAAPARVQQAPAPPRPPMVRVQNFQQNNGRHIEAGNRPSNINKPSVQRSTSPSSSGVSTHIGHPSLQPRTKHLQNPEQRQPEITQPPARPPTEDESARSQGFRDAAQLRSFKQTGVLQAPPGALSAGRDHVAPTTPGTRATSVNQTAHAPVRPQMEHLQTPEQRQPEPEDEYARSQGFRDADQLRKYNETGVVEAPLGTVSSGRAHPLPVTTKGPTTKENPFKPQQFNVPNNPKPESPTVQFQQNREIEGSKQWVGSKYQAFRNYRCEWHQRDWWRHHHSRFVCVSGGWYYWNAGWWYPAWGYASNAYYAYDGPIYAVNDLSPDQAIANVQRVLQELGYYHGPINGVLDAFTRAAIAHYQRDHGLYITSAIDEPTLASLGMA